MIEKKQLLLEETGMEERFSILFPIPQMLQVASFLFLGTHAKQLYADMRHQYCDPPPPVNEQMLRFTPQESLNLLPLSVTSMVIAAIEAAVKDEKKITWHIHQRQNCLRDLTIIPAQSLKNFIEYEVFMIITLLHFPSFL